VDLPTISASARSLKSTRTQIGVIRVHRTYRIQDQSVTLVAIFVADDKQRVVLVSTEGDGYHTALASEISMYSHIQPTSDERALAEVAADWFMGSGFTPSFDVAHLNVWGLDHPGMEFWVSNTPNFQGPMTAELWTERLGRTAIAASRYRLVRALLGSLRRPASAAAGGR
jgi:hypothetical protein